MSALLRILGVIIVVFAAKDGIWWSVTAAFGVLLVVIGTVEEFL